MSSAASSTVQTLPTKSPAVHTFGIFILKLLFVSIPLIVSLCFYAIVFRYKLATGYWPHYMVYHPQIRPLFFSGEGIAGSLDWFLMFPAIFGLPFALLMSLLGIAFIKENADRKLTSKKVIILMSALLGVGGLLTLSIVTVNIGFLTWMLD